MSPGRAGAGARRETTAPETAIGDVVNVASRLQAANEEDGTEMLVSDSVFAACSAHIDSGGASTSTLAKRWARCAAMRSSQRSRSPVRRPEVSVAQSRNGLTNDASELGVADHRSLRSALVDLREADLGENLA